MKGLKDLMPAASSTVTVAVTLLLLAAVASAAPNLGDKLNDAAKKLDNIADNICFINENCNTFWTLKNYCCTPQCCDVISYITRNDNYWKNFTETFEHPRAMNIILAVLFTLLFILLIGVIVKLICCLFCGCCGSKKYVIVGRGD